MIKIIKALKFYILQLGKDIFFSKKKSAILIKEVEHLSTFSDSEYVKLRNLKYRTLSSSIYPIFKLFSKITKISLDFFVIDLREKNPELFTLNRCDKSLYKKIQIEANIRKLDRGKTGKEELIKPIVDNFVNDHIVSSQDHIKGVCMGARNGSEVIAFEKMLDKALKKMKLLPTVNVIGTDISPSATLFPNMIVHDFHETLPENIGQVDFIYSNSLDQSNNPKKALSAWIDSLTPCGVIYLDYSSRNGKQSFSMLDPFSCEIELFPFVFLKWMSGKAFIQKAIFREEIPNSATFVIKKISNI